MNTALLVIGISLITGWLAIEITSQLLRHLRKHLEEIFIGTCSIGTALVILAIIFSLGII